MIATSQYNLLVQPKVSTWLNVRSYLIYTLQDITLQKPST